MANESGQVDSLFDEPAIVAQFERIGSLVDKLGQQLIDFQQLNEKMRVSNTFKDLNESIKQTQTQLDQLQKVNQQYVKTEVELNKVIVAQERVRKAKLATDEQVIRNLEAEERAEAALLNKQKTAIQLTETQTREQQRSYQESVKSQQAYTNAQRAGVQLQNEQIRQQELQLRLQQQQNRSAQQAAAQQAAANRQAQNAADLYFQLVKQLKDAERSYRNLAIAQGVESAAAKAELANVTQMRGVIDRLNTSLRGIGNSQTYFNSLGFSFAQVARELPTLGVNTQLFFLAISNNLPIVVDEITKAATEIKRLKAAGEDTPTLFQKIGSSLLSFNVVISAAIAILTIYGKEITDFIGSLFNMQKAFDYTRESHRKFVEVITDARKSSQQEIIDLKIARKAIEDENLPRETRLAILKEQQEKYPGFLDSLNKESALAGKAAAAFDLLSKALFQKAYAEAASNKAAELGLKTLELQDKARFLVGEQVKTQKQLNAVIALGTQSQTYINFYGSLVKHLKEINNQLKDNRQEQIFTNVETDRYIKESEKFASVLQSLIKGKKGADEKDIERYKDYWDKVLKAQQEGEKLQLEDAIKFNQAIADSEAFAFEERARRATIAGGLRRQLIRQTQNAELQQLEQEYKEQFAAIQDSEADLLKDTKISQDKRTEALANYSKERNILQLAFEMERKNIILKTDYAIRDEEIKTLAELGELRKKEMEKQRKEAEENYKAVHRFDEFEKPNLKHASDRNTSLISALVEMENKAFAELQDIRATNFEKERNAIRNRYKENQISYSEYLKQMQDLEVQNQKEGLQDRLANLNKQLDVFKQLGSLGTAEALKIQAAIAKIEAELNGMDFKEVSGKILKLKDIFEKVAAGLDKITKLIGMAVDNGITRDKNNLQALEDQQQKNYENQVERINKSSLTEEEKAHKLTNLEATRAAQKERNDRREREIDRRKAVFDKAVTISKIISETALAVIRALADNTVPYPVRLGYAISAGAFGLAQLGIAAGAPIPNFEYGTKSSPEGIAQVSERGQELGITPEGQMFMTPKKRSLMYLQKGTQIIPANQVDNYIYNLMLRRTVDNIQKDTINEDVMPIIAKQQLRVMQKMANKPNKPYVIIVDNEYSRKMKN